MAITPLPTPIPSRDQDSEEFSTNADAFLGAIPTFATEANALQADVNAKADAAAASETAAALSETNAANSETVAAGAANYQGDYDAGTLYAVGESVSYLGFVYVKKTNAAAGTTPADGTDWFLVRRIIEDVQTFTASGTWTKPAGATWVLVEAISGGGGGGSDIDTGAPGGGSGGEYVSKTFRASDLAATESVTVGAGGLGGADGTNAAGNAGGNSSFGSHITAIGGNPGLLSSAGGTIPRSPDSSWTAANAESLEHTIAPQSGYGGPANTDGGNTIHGGGGGGGGGTGTQGTGGTSEFAGGGGAANLTAATKGGNGTAPGGGGGGSSNDGGGGDGGDGQVKVTSW